MAAHYRKGDVDGILENGTKSIELDPKNLYSLVIMAEVLPQPQVANRGGDAEKEKTLARAENYATQALQLVEQLPRQAAETDEQFAKRKTLIAATPHSSLGMVHLLRAQMSLTGTDAGELVKAEQEYQTAISMSEQPNATDHFRLGEIRSMLNKVDGAIEAFTKAAELGQGTVIQQLADRNIEDLKKRKQ